MRTPLIALAVALLSNLAAAEQPLTNADVVKLVKAGVSADVIVAKIQASETAFATDADSLVALANEKVPNPVIQAMMARTPAPTVPAAPAAAPAAAAAAVPAAAPPEKPKTEVTEVVIKGLVRTRGICTARGDLTMTGARFTFKPVDKSPVCSEETFGQSGADFAWDDVSRICFEYVVSGTVQIWLKDGRDMSFKTTRADMENLATRMQTLHPGLPVRCED